MRKAIKNWWLRNFICPTIFSKGHIPVKEVRETECVITQYKCQRCDCTLGIGHYKGIRSIHPPNSNPEQVQQWNEYCDQKEANLRLGITD